MSRIFDFKKRFGENIDINDVRENFLNKISHYLVEPLDKKDGSNYDNRSKEMFDFVALEFNQNPSGIVEKFNRGSDGIYELDKPSFGVFTGENFEGTLLLIEVFYNYFSNSDVYQKDTWLELIDKTVEAALSQPISLGITWRDGNFYPEGVEEFDEKLISDVLKWLKEKPEIRELYKNSLDHYSTSLKSPIKRKDVIVNSFQAVEKLTQDYLQSNKGSFDNNFNALTDKLELDKEWNKIFNSYKELSKSFGRHAGKGRNFIPGQEDTEAFLYLSGLVLRLILEKSALQTNEN